MSADKKAAPRVAVFTMTRDRIGYTKRTFRSMADTSAGHPYDHWVFDQGSTDGTVDWLKESVALGNIMSYSAWGENVGLHVGMNRAHRALLDAGYDYIMKVDNDAEFKTKHWLRKLLRAQSSLGNRSVVSPRIVGLSNPVIPFAKKRIGGFRVSFMSIIGGICRLMPRDAIEDFEFCERLPLAHGGDAWFADYCKRENIPLVYIEDIRVRHMDSTQRQELDNPDYFNRKFFESYIPYGI